MKGKIICPVLIMIVICSYAIHAQDNYYIVVDQPLSLVADAGHDTSIVAGNSVQLGGDPSALNGYGDYIYLWQPATGLDDPTSPNPVSTTASTITYILNITDSHGCTAQGQVTVTTEIGIHDVLNRDVNIYPNPANDIFTIDFNNASGKINLEIFNYLGSLLYRELLEVEPSSHENIDLGRFGKGVFFINLCGHNFITRKMIVNQ